MMRKIVLVLLAGLLAGFAAAQEDGLALYLPFETDTGATVQDASGNGHHGTAANCAWTSAGRFAGGAMSFNGANSSIVFPTVPDFPSWDAYSVSVWVKHDGGGYLGNYQYGHKIIDKSSLNHDLSIVLNPLGYPHLGIPPGYIGVGVNENGASCSFYDGYNYMDNVWHHVVFLRNGSVGQLWIDGVLKDSKNNMVSVHSASAFCVGNSFSADPYQCISWSGLLDEVRIYNRPLSPEEIGQLHTGGPLPPEPPPSVPTVSSVTAAQRPGTTLVDISYDLAGDANDALTVSVSLTAGGAELPAVTLTGDIGADITPGIGKCITWDAGADWPGNFADDVVAAVTVSGTADAPAAEYLVFDLSGGTGAASYPATTLNAEPDGGWVDEHKTTKLVLRKIPAGTFSMGSLSDELGRNSDENPHEVTLTQDFYLGVFEVTQKQWELVMGTTPAYLKGDTRPVETISYGAIRGATLGAQ